MCYFCCLFPSMGGIRSASCCRLRNWLVQRRILQFYPGSNFLFFRKRVKLIKQVEQNKHEQHIEGSTAISWLGSFVNPFYKVEVNHILNLQVNCWLLQIPFTTLAPAQGWLPGHIETPIVIMILQTTKMYWWKKILKKHVLFNKLVHNIKCFILSHKFTIEALSNETSSSKKWL